MKRIHIRKPLNRSHLGNFAVLLMLVVVGIFMGLPLYYNIIQAFKPVEERFIFPPRFYVVNPTWTNFTQLFQLVSDLTVPSADTCSTAYLSVSPVQALVF